LGCHGADSLSCRSWAETAHLPYWKKSDRYDIVSLQNTSKEGAERAVAHHKLPNNPACYGDIESLVKDTNVNMIAVSVKVPLHASAIRPALEAGRDVFSEWPLGKNLAETQELATLAKEKGVRTMIGLQARQNPVIRKVKDLVQGGEIGTVLGSTLTGYGGIFAAPVPDNQSYLLEIENGANILSIPLAHTLDAVCYALGELSSLVATLANNQPRILLQSGETVDKTAHDFISFSGILERDDGVLSVVYQAGSSPIGKDLLWEIYGSKGTLVVQGNTGHGQMATLTLKATNSSGELVEVEGLEQGGPSYNVGKAWEAYAATDDHPPNFDDAVARHRLIDAIYRSDEKGKRVYL
jgi:predicted dehydrogenase